MDLSIVRLVDCWIFGLIKSLIFFLQILTLKTLLLILHYSFYTFFSLAATCAEPVEVSGLNSAF